MPVKLVSLAKTPKEKEAEARPMTEGRPVEDIEDYPWGLTFTLEDAELRKLGLAGGALEPGDVVTLAAKAMVTHANAEAVNTANRYHVTLQLQQMAMEKEQMDKELSETFYGAT